MTERVIASAIVGTLSGIVYGAAVYMADPHLGPVLGAIIAGLVGLITFIMLRKG